MIFIGTHLSANKRFEVVQDIIKSGHSIRRYCELNPQYAPSTVSKWKRDFDKEMANQIDNRINPLPFIDVTEESNNLAMMNSKTNMGLSNTCNRDVIDSINEAKPLPSNRTIKLTTSKVSLEFDIEVLKEVMEILS